MRRAAAVVISMILGAGFGVGSLYAAPQKSKKAKISKSASKGKPKGSKSSNLVGIASWYGGSRARLKTASGEVFNARAFSAAHPSWSMGTWVRVTHLRNGRSIVVRINDRMPAYHGRVLDLSKGAAEALGFIRDGLAKVKLEIVPAPKKVLRGPASLVHPKASSDASVHS